jgi:hypothetical protein
MLDDDFQDYVHLLFKRCENNVVRMFFCTRYSLPITILGELNCFRLRHKTYSNAHLIFWNLGKLSGGCCTGEALPLG